MHNLGSKISTVKAQQFLEDHSASGGSVDFHQLGIAAPSVKQIEIQHPDVSVYPKASDCCTAVPGETVLVKGPNTIVFDVCGVFYEASRADGSKN